MKIVLFEGINRSGKSTQLVRANEALQAMGFKVRTVKFPTRETPIGSLIYDYFEGRRHMEPLTLQYLLESNKVEWQRQFSLWEADGLDLLLIDRYDLSGLAHGIGRGIDPDLIVALQSPLRKPHLTFLFDVDVELAAARSQVVLERDEQDLALLRRARAAFKELAVNAPTVQVIDASQSPEAIHRIVMGAILLESALV